MNISVVIPAYNEEGNIGDCLDHLVPQLQPGDEIIVLDNGSEDNTAEIAASRRFTQVIHAPDSKLPSNGRKSIGPLRQLGSKRASNEVIASTDADTLPPSGWVDRIKSHFREDPDLDLVWGIAVDSNGVPIRDLSGRYWTLVGGVSGCNTAFRKSTFEEMEKGYMDDKVFEDVTFIVRMSTIGKVKHDRNLKMVTHLDRRRYQTYPIAAAGLGSIALGQYLGGRGGDILTGAGIGSIGTELIYEYMTDSRFHHDQIGLSLASLGWSTNHSLSDKATGTGLGIAAHHVLTEGLSMAPTELSKQTEEIVQ